MAAAVGLGALASCANSPKDVACSTADFFALGREDGRGGDKDRSFKNMADACEDRGLPVDEEAYRNGYDAGLAMYCTPKGGFHAGLDHDSYEKVCPADAEVAFLVAFEMGDRLRRLETQAKDARRDISQAKKDRDRNAFSLNDALSRLRDTFAAGPDIAVAHRDVEYHRSEVQRLDEMIPKLEAAAEEADRALQEYREALAANGMIATDD